MMLHVLIGVLIAPRLIECSSPPLSGGEHSCANLPGMTVVQDCDTSSPYRTQNGQCNNLGNPQLGAAVTPFRRLQHNSYNDGLSTPRTLKLPTSDEIELPNARLLSKELFPQSDNPDNPWKASLPSPKSTSLASVFGQFLTHDITLTSQGGPEERFDITIPQNDEVFEDTIPMKRVKRCTSTESQVQEQINAATSFIDASHIYGNSEADLNKMRDLNSEHGLLRTTCRSESVKNLLLQVPEGENSVFCRSSSCTKPCFYTGDYRRNNVSPALNTLHTIWVREHNRVAMTLSGLNTNWDSDKIFQETRKIIGAMMQHISYNEYLPTVLSEQMLQTYNLKLDNYAGYDSLANPSIANSFAAAALRLGHSTVGNVYTRPGHTDMKVDDFHNPAPLYDLNEGGVDAILKGLFDQSARKIDRYFASALTRRLIPSPGVKADLAAINIQRGRDHGIPAYVVFRNLFEAGNDNNIPVELRDKLLKAELYGDMKNVDLFVGGMLETPQAGARVGPTFSHILAEGFKNLREGDRFWYENELDEKTKFTPDQINEIKRATMARIICDNSDGIVDIQPYAMLKETFAESSNNQKVNCNQLPFMDLNKWKEGGESTSSAGKRTVNIENSNTQYAMPEHKSALQDSMQDGNLKEVEAETSLENILTGGLSAKKRFKAKQKMLKKGTHGWQAAEDAGNADYKGK